MRISMLDMGERKYGDATLCEVDGVLILVDGGHRGDERHRDVGAKSIPDQLAALTGGGPPFDVDLVVVTHCHSDHIGCLPELIREGIIKPKWALLADPRMGFGVPLGQDFPVVARKSSDRVAAALREEILPSTASDHEVREVIDAAATLQDRYHDMVTVLQAASVNVVRHGRDSHFGLEREFQRVGLAILGPTVEQILICAGRIERDRLRRSETVSDASADGEDEVALYRMLATRYLADGDELEDGGTGAALNDQSIVLKVGVEPNAAILMGDMQFASPGVGGLRARVAALRQAVGNAGPYAFARLAHHGAPNGTDGILLNVLRDTMAFGISTGSGDPSHPSKTVLTLLAGCDPRVDWARTDANGLVTVDIADGAVSWSISSGSLSDATVSVGSKDGKERASERLTRRPRVSGATPVGRLRRAPTLTFVTSRRALAARIGDDCDKALDVIRRAGHGVLDVEPGAFMPGDVARAARGSSGLVILGGHGVIPSVLIDALPRAVRRNYRTGSFDPEDFVVWSDDPYGDADGTGLPQIPVSRIPDAGDGAFLLKALDPEIRAVSGRYGLRNALRPFADGIFAGIVGGEPMLLSEPLAHGGLRPDAMDVEDIYLMLHGDADDGTVFSGERRDPVGGEAQVPVMTVSCLPERCGGTVFAGSCYGALVLRESDADVEPVELTVPSSLALSFLNAGARAFVGSVGTHWSPRDFPYRSAAGPFHEAFWRGMGEGRAPARALLDAKIDYALGMPYGGTLPIEYKTWRQFTCLGLGW